MPARHAVLLTRLECAVPLSILYSKQSRPVTSLESALTSQPQLVENTATLSPVECALTSLSPATPLECAVPKNLGGGGPFFPFRKQSTPSQRQGPLVYPERSRSKIPALPERATHHSPQYSSSFFSHSCALFCAFLHFFAQTKNSTLFFSIASALFGKNTPGWGYPLPRARFARGPLPSSVIFPASPLRGTARRHVCSYLYVLTSLHRCFFISLQYNRCACIRGRNEFQPASRRNTNRLRAPLLGRQ